MFHGSFTPGLFQWENRGQDNIKIYSADPPTGKIKEIYDEKQATWVDFFTDLYFMSDGSGFHSSGFDIAQKDLWLAMTGCVGDWFLPPFMKEFCEKYPDLLDESFTNPGQALFDSKIGELARLALPSAIG